MGTGIPSVRGVTQPSNGSVGRRDVVRPRPLHHPSDFPEHLSLLLNPKNRSWKAGIGAVSFIFKGDVDFSFSPSG